MGTKSIKIGSRKKTWQNGITGYIALYKNGHSIRKKRFHDSYERIRLYKEFMKVVNINGEDSWDIRILLDDKY